MSTKRELQEEAERYRDVLEETYDALGEVLGFEGNVAEDDDDDPNASEDEE